MLLEADLIAKWAALRWLVERYPHWTHHELAAAQQMSRSWVSKWLHRLRQADQEDVMVLQSRSCARHTPPASIASHMDLLIYLGSAANESYEPCNI